jgi:hypothetical protein
MAQTMSMGQAAGLAAIQSIKTDCDAKAVDVGILRNELSKLGQILEVPEKVADTGRNAWSNNL